MSEVLGGDAAKAKSLEKARRFESMMLWGAAACIVFFLFNTLSFILLFFPGREYSSVEYLANLFSFGEDWYIFWVPACGGSAPAALIAALALSKKTLSTRDKAIALIASVILDIVIVVGLFFPLVMIAMLCSHTGC